MKVTGIPLLDFLYSFPPPATAVELWGEINSVRVYAGNPLADLPASAEQLADELRLLAIQGRVMREGEYWRPVQPAAKVARREAQTSLFI